MNETIESNITELQDEKRQLRANTVAHRLAQLRREQGLSQDAVGRLVGASQATVSRWEDPASLSTPSALELAELAERFEVDLKWIVGLRDHREELPEGQAIIDQALLDRFARCTSSADLKGLLAGEMTFGTIWVQIPESAEVVGIEEALRRVKQVDRHVRRLCPELWHEWAGVVLS